MEITTLNPEDNHSQTLISMSDEYMVTLYPSESNHLESVQALALPNVKFVGVHVEGKLVACGAVKTLDDEEGAYGEIKRVFVLAEYRGKGLSKKIMEHLEAHLRESGVKLARLETGIKQPAALGLYRGLGYKERGPFGTYVHDPLSVFMEKYIEA
jgi:putative acetyltransferase